MPVWSILPTSAQPPFLLPPPHRLMPCQRKIEPRCWPQLRPKPMIFRLATGLTWVRRAFYRLAWSRRFFGSWYASRTQRPADDVVQDLVSSESTWRLFTHRGMETLGIHLLTTWTAAWDAQTQAKTHTNSNTHCFIVKPQTTISNRESQQPISTMWC